MKILNGFLNKRMGGLYHFCQVIGTYKKRQQDKKPYSRMLPRRPRLAGETLSYSVKFGLLPAKSLRNANLHKLSEGAIDSLQDKFLTTKQSYRLENIFIC